MWREKVKPLFRKKLSEKTERKYILTCFESLDSEQSILRKLPKKKSCANKK